MRTVIIIMTAVSVIGVCNVQAEIVWDSGHHVFSEGSETYVTMLNDASADITGGWIAEFYMLNETTAEVFGGTILQLLCQDTSTATIYDNDYMDLLRPNDSSIADVYGGDINVVFTLGSSVTNIYGGTINEIDATDLSIVNIFSESYEFDPTGGAFGDGLLTGTWLYGGGFSIELVTEETINHLNFVPEPTTLFLFGIGGLIVLKKVRNK